MTFGRLIKSLSQVTVCHTRLVPNYLPLAFDMVPLAAFPWPSPPAPASQKVLSLQGLDPGLLDAETVDSTHTVSIGSPHGDGLDTSSSLGLSPKTRKRLKELGITELFAGENSFQIRGRLLLNRYLTSAICSYTVPAPTLSLPTRPLHAI